MSIRNTAKSIGNKDASTAELAATIRKVYVKAKPEVQAEIRADFHIGYIAGRDRVSISDAAAIWQAGKGADAINAPAIVRAVAAWKYHVADHFAAPEAAPVKRMRLSAEVRAAAKDFLAMFDNVAEAKKALDAVAK